MEKVVILNRPLWFVETGGDIRKLVEVLGFLMPHNCDCDAASLESYLDYLCGVSKWEQEGNSFENNADDCTWVSSVTGEAFVFFAPFIQKYLKRARQQKYLTYLVFETNIILDKDTEGILDGEFIISRKLYNDILEYGAIVEDGCQNNGNNKNQDGGLTN